ncbi:MAG: sigma-70 family RNA polymerase sigma factor [Spirochaetes bacterium]|nr:sigma-70 family RNA polymerase sigma factor [Spirochaetota bacterium]
MVNYEKRFNQLYRNYFRDIVGFIYRRIHNSETAEEMAQEIFANLFEKKKELSPESSNSKRYLFVCARNKLIDYYRQNKPHTVSEPFVNIEDLEMNKLNDCDLENMIIRDEIITTFYSTLLTFHHAKRKAYLSCIIKDKSSKYNQKYYRFRRKVMNEVNEIMRIKLSEYEDMIK